MGFYVKILDFNINEKLIVKQSLILSNKGGRQYGKKGEAKYHS